MALLSHFLIGFGASIIGSLPPGMISLTVLNTSIEHNLKQGFNVAVAASLVEFFQAFIAITFSGLIANNVWLNSFIQLSAIPVFLALAGFFLFKSSDSSRMSGKGHAVSGFGKGLLVGVLNLLPVPFWIFWSSYFAANGWIDFRLEHLFCFVFGISAGTLLVLLLYGKLGLIIVGKIGIMQRWINRTISLVFLVLAIYEIADYLAN